MLGRARDVPGRIRPPVLPMHWAMPACGPCTAQLDSLTILKDIQRGVERPRLESQAIEQPIQEEDSQGHEDVQAGSWVVEEEEDETARLQYDVAAKEHLIPPLTKCLKACDAQELIASEGCDAEPYDVSCEVPPHAIASW